MKRARKRKSTGKAKKRFTTFLVSLITIVVAFYAIRGIRSFVIWYNNPMTAIESEAGLEPVEDGKVNMLILGVDADGLRTDTIMVASYDIDMQKVNLLSVPRDTRMYIRDYGYQKINTAHALTENGKIRGVAGTIEAVKQLTGLPINFYVEFTFETFKEAIDILGGVEFDVPERMKYSDPYQDLYIDLYPGLQVLDGDKAEQLVRFRQYKLGDIKRIETQQNFLKAVAEQKLNAKIITKLPDMFDMLKDNINTNLTPKQVAAYARTLKDLSAENVVMHQLPGRFSETGEYSSSYWIVDVSGVKELIAETFGYPEEAEEISVGPAEKSKTTNSSSTTKTTETSKNTTTSASKSNTTTRHTTNNSTTSASKNNTDSTTTAKEDESEEIITIPDAE